MQRRFGAGFIQQPVTGPTFIDKTSYTDDTQFQEEIDQIFTTRWLRALRSDELREPGDFVLWERFGQTVVVVRKSADQIVAFHNVCQHRGARLVEGSGSCQGGRFVCPWHGFAYDLDGVVVHVPRRDTFAPEVLDGLRAPEVATAEWGGWVWLNLAGPACEPLDEYLGEMRDELDWYRMQEWKVWGHGTWTIHANWKVVQEGFLEAWHVPFSHKHSLPGARLDRNVTFHTMGPHNMMVMAGRRANELAHDDDADHRAVAVPHYLVWPNSLWNCTPKSVQAQTAWPIDVNTTLFEVWGLGPAHQPDPGRSDDEWSQLQERIWENTVRVIGEDVALAQEAGATRRSVGYTGSRLNDQEHRISHFHSVLDAELSGGDGS